MKTLTDGLAQTLILKLRHGYVQAQDIGIDSYAADAVMSNAANAIERLENEAVAATLRIENDKLEIERLKSLADVGFEMVKITTCVWKSDEWPAIPDIWTRCMDERDELRAQRDAYQQASDRMAAAHKVERDGLRAELDKLKQQEPIGYLYREVNYYGSRVGSKGEYQEFGVPIFLAAGASKP